MEPIIQLNQAPERELLEKRLRRSREKLQRIEEKERKAWDFKEVEDLELRLALLDADQAMVRQRLTLQALEIDEKRSSIAHQSAYAELVRQNTEAINRQTDALLEIAKAITGRS